MSVLAEVGIIVLLALINGLLSGAEIAVVTVRPTRLRALVAGGSRAARAVERLRARPERFLATVQIGITVVGATAAVYGGANFAVDLAPLLVGAGLPAEHAAWGSAALVVMLLSYLSLVLGELVPKSLALKRPEGYALATGFLLLGLSWLARPLVWLLTASSNAVLRGFGDETTFVEARMTGDELRQLVEEAAASGTVHPQAGEIASRALDFSKLTAADVMLPRNEVVSLPLDGDEATLRRVVLSHVHSRLPVYEGTNDRVTGYVSLKDLLGPAWEHRPVELRALLRTPLFVPLFKPAPELLHEMRSRRQPFAVVVDERGSCAGLVTMEDLVEELVGEIFNEHAVSDEAFTWQPDGSVVVRAATSVRDVNRELGLSLPERGAWKTLAGLVLERLGAIPAVGAVVTLDDGTRVEILEASAWRVRLVRLRLARR